METESERDEVTCSRWDLRPGVLSVKSVHFSASCRALVGVSDAKCPRIIVVKASDLRGGENAEARVVMSQFHLVLEGLARRMRRGVGKVCGGQERGMQIWPHALC